MLYNIKELRNYIMISQNITIHIISNKGKYKAGSSQAISFKLQNIINLTNY